MKKKRGPGSILISRIDAIGDVVLTLPMASLLKSLFPGVKIYFLGSAYTEAVVACCPAVDLFIEKESFLSGKADVLLEDLDVFIHVFPNRYVARKAQALRIPNRIGTSHRLYNLLTCNRLVNFSRQKSDLHEAQLNLKLLAPLGYRETPSLATIASWLQLNSPPAPDYPIDRSFFNLILHPHSRGNAREWPAAYYAELVKLLPADRYRIYITGSAKEGEELHQNCPELFTESHVTDLTGKFTLAELSHFINQADGLIAASTGPLHLAGVMGKFTLGIYPPSRPMYPGRWAAIGPKVTILTSKPFCEGCLRTDPCSCINAVSPLQVKGVVEGWQVKKPIPAS